jgi:hypothetical protein
VEALIGLAEEDQVIRGLARCAGSIGALPWRDVDFAAEDRIDATLAGFVVKDDGREHVAVLGHGQRGHLELGRTIEKLADAARAVEQRELGV